MAGKQVALLRGINVGRGKRVAMADLRALVQGLGYRDVSTLLNSGNVIFSGGRATPGDAAARIEKALAARTGISARVTVITAAEIAAAIAENPLSKVADDPSRLLVAVLAEKADRKRVATLLDRDWAPEVLAIGGRVAYLWLPFGVIDSRLAKEMSRLLGDAVTMRNWATLTKLHALIGDAR